MEGLAELRDGMGELRGKFWKDGRTQGKDGKCQGHTLGKKLTANLTFFLAYHVFKVFVP